MAIKDKATELFLKYKDVIFQKKKGEALERASTPISSEEAASLGHFEPIANLTGNGLKAVEILLAQLAYGTNEVPEVTWEMGEMVDNIFRASGSKAAKRMLATFETIQEIKPDIQTQKYNLPESTDYRDQ